MLKIGKLTDYALLVMSQMAKDPHSILSASLLAESTHLTSPTVSKILKILAESHLVTSVRGAEGGYRLAKPASEISVGAVINAMEGGLAITECCEMTSLCSIDSLCTMRENWRKINKMVQVLLDKFTIIDMTRPINTQESPSLLVQQSNQEQTGLLRCASSDSDA